MLAFLLFLKESAKHKPSISNKNYMKTKSTLIKLFIVALCCIATACNPNMPSKASGNVNNSVEETPYHTTQLQTNIFEIDCPRLGDKERSIEKLTEWLNKNPQYRIKSFAGILAFDVLPLVKP